MPNEQGLGGEGIWLDIHISPGHPCITHMLLSKDENT